MIGLTNSERLVLNYLAINGPSIGYQIPELTSFTSSRAPRSLEEKGLVVRKHGKSLENPRLHSMISLTAWGLAICIDDRGEPGINIMKNSKLQTIISKWRNQLLPFVFGKWGLFEKEGVEDIAYLNLVLAVNSLLNEGTGPETMIRELKEWKRKANDWQKQNQPKIVKEYNPWSGKEEELIQWTPFPYSKPKISTSEEQEKRFSMWFYHQNLSRVTKDSKRWFEACSKDDDIRIYLLNSIDRFINGNISQTKNLEANRQILSND